MTSPSTPPDLSALSISNSSNSRFEHDYDTLPGGQQHAYHFSAAQGHSPYATVGASPLRNRPAARGGLPTQWTDQPGLPEQRSLSPQNTDLSSLSSGGSPPMGHAAPPPMVATPPVPFGADEEVIPTAIVIKNIPFNVKRETLLDIIISLNIPTPYAFNYHLDPSGAFRGLAFANFRQPSDADAVVVALNGFDVQGRKLRVEYKKVLQAGEKERIEREKALRRMRSMQLEKEQLAAASSLQTYDDFGSPVPPAFTPQRSFSGGLPFLSPTSPYSPPPMPPMPHLGSYTSVQSMPAASPVVQTPGGLGNPLTPGGAAPGGPLKSSTELDLNDPATLEIYSRILLFKDDRMRDELAFSRTLTAKQRRVVHLVAQKLGVYHYSVGEGEERYAVVTRINPDTQQQQAPPRLSRAPSAYHLSAQAQAQAQAAPSLRMKKSMPDMAALRSQAPRLNTRISNGNIREGYATIASPARRTPSGLGALFGVPPVPTLPASVVHGAQNGGAMESPTSGVVRQPRGPGVMGFARQRVPSEAKPPAGLEARSHEPLEI